MFAHLFLSEAKGKREFNVWKATRKGKREFNVWEATRKGYFNDVRLDVEGGLTNINVQDARGTTLLMLAIRNNFMKIAKYLLSREDIDVTLKATNGLTALGELCLNKTIDQEVLKLLLDKGADVNETNQYGTTPLYWAVVYQQTQAVKLLIEHRAPVNQMTLEHAFAHCDETIIRLILSGNPDLVGFLVAIDKNEDLLNHTFACLTRVEYDFRKSVGKTLLMHCIEEADCSHVVEALITHGAPVNAKEDGQRTAIWYAVTYRRLDCVEMLLKHGATLRNLSEVTPLR